MTESTRRATVERRTSETELKVELLLDGSGQHQVATGVGFLDHMLRQLAVFGLLDLRVEARGDLEVDAHHTVEDCALALGAALDQSLGDRRGIARVGAAKVPMDEALAEVVLDLSGRPFAVFQGSWHAPTIGQLPTSLVAHFLRSFSVTARCNLHAAVLHGEDDHHQAEALFKAFGRALAQAVAVEPRLAGQVRSTKGVL